MLNLLRRKKEELITAPCNGFVIQIEDVKDAMFSNKLLGDGFAIYPSADTICAPCDGTIVMIANTAHAFGITTKQGVELLVHVGLDTVNLNGKGFQILAGLNQKVKIGTPILKLDLPFMKARNLDLTIPVIVTNGNEYTLTHMIREGEVDNTQDIMNIMRR